MKRTHLVRVDPAATAGLPRVVAPPLAPLRARRQHDAGDSGEVDRAFAAADHLAGKLTPRRLFLGWLAVGLGLRLLVLPSALHTDTLAVYFRVLLIERGDADLGVWPFQVLPQALHCLWAALCGCQLPDLQGLPWPDGTLREAYAVAARELAAPGALLSVAAWKFPYLLADLAAGYLLARAAGLVRGERAFALWMLHPIALYSGMLFGKYEAFMIVPLLLGLHALCRERPVAGFLWIGAAVAMRLYPLLLVPPLVLAYGPGARDRLRHALLALAPAATLALAALSGHAWAWIAVPLAASIGVWACLRCEPRRLLLLAVVALGAAAISASERLGDLLGSLAAKGSSAHKILEHAGQLGETGIGSQDPILVFGILYLAACLWAHRRAALRPARAAALRGDDLLRAALLAALSFYAVARFNPQYALLLVPLVVLAAPRLVDAWPAHALQVLGLLLCAFGAEGGATTSRLFLPLAPEALRASGDPLAALGDPWSGLPWVSIGRTLLAAGCLWMAVGMMAGTMGGVAGGLMAAQRGASGAPGAAWRPRHPPPISSHAARCWLAAAFAAWPLALAGALALALAGRGESHAGEAYASELGWVPGEPAVFLDFDTRSGFPTSLEVRPPTLARAAEWRGLSLELERLDLPGVAAQRTWIPQLRLLAEDGETWRFELGDFDLDPGARYRVHFERTFGPALPPASVQPLIESPPGALWPRAVEESRARLGASAAALVSASGLLLAILGALGLACVRPVIGAAAARP